MKNKAKLGVKPFVYVPFGVAALGGLLFGYDTGVISGAILFIKSSFRSPPRWRRLSSALRRYRRRYWRRSNRPLRASQNDHTGRHYLLPSAPAARLRRNRLLG
jgi:hypothetical protein